jgi:hypothetical protein
MRPSLKLRTICWFAMRAMLFRDLHALASGGHPQVISEMGHRARPAQHDLVVGSEDIFNDNIHVGKGATNALGKCCKLRGCTKFGPIFKLADCHRIGSKKLMNSLELALAEVVNLSPIGLWAAFNFLGVIRSGRDLQPGWRRW